VNNHKIYNLYLIALYLISGLSLAKASPAMVSVDKVNEAKSTHALEIEAYVKKGVHPAYALAAILRDEGGEENAHLAAAILETGIGFGGIDPGKKFGSALRSDPVSSRGAGLGECVLTGINYDKPANSLETAIGQLTAFSLGANFKGEFFTEKTCGIGERHQRVLRDFYVRGKKMFSELDDDFDSDDEDIEVETTQSFVASLPDTDPIKISARLVINTFAMDLSVADYLEEMLTPYLKMSQLSVNDRTNYRTLRKWVNGELWSREYTANVLQASLLVLGDPENLGDLTEKALSNISLGMNYALRPAFVEKFPVLYQKITNLVINQKRDLENLIKVHRMSEKHFSVDYWNSILSERSQIDPDQYFNQLQISVEQGMKALLILAENYPVVWEPVLNRSVNTLTWFLEQNPRLGQFLNKAFLQMALSVKKVVDNMKRENPMFYDSSSIESLLTKLRQRYG
jgi:hypothetical protein